MFVLKHYYGYSSRDIAPAYSITDLYVPTVVKHMIERYANEPIFRERLMRVLNDLENAEEILDGTGS